MNKYFYLILTIGITTGTIIGIIRRFYPEVWDKNYAYGKIYKDTELDEVVLKWYNIPQWDINEGITFHVFGSKKGKNSCIHDWYSVDMHVPIGNNTYQDTYTPGVPTGEYRFKKPEKFSSFVMCDVKGSYTYEEGAGTVSLPCISWRWGTLRDTTQEQCIFDYPFWIMLFIFSTITICIFGRIFILKHHDKKAISPMYSDGDDYY